MTIRPNMEQITPEPTLSLSSCAMSPDVCVDQINRSCMSDSSNKNSPITFKSITEVAKERWLKVAEIEFLLNHDTTPLPILTKPSCNRPPSGSLFLFDRNTTLTYKEDGYHWIKKRNSPKVREDHVKLRMKGKYRVAGIYCHSMNPLSLHRRAYHLLDHKTGVTKTPVVLHRSADVDYTRPSLVLVHYLDTVSAGQMKNNSTRSNGKKRGRETTNNAAIKTQKTENDVMRNTLEQVMSLSYSPNDSHRSQVSNSSMQHNNWGMYSSSLYDGHWNKSPLNKPSFPSVLKPGSTNKVVHRPKPFWKELENTNKLLRDALFNGVDHANTQPVPTSMMSLPPVEFVTNGCETANLSREALFDGADYACTQPVPISTMSQPMAEMVTSGCDSTNNVLNDDVVLDSLWNFFIGDDDDTTLKTNDFLDNNIIEDIETIFD